MRAWLYDRLVYSPELQDYLDVTAEQMTQRVYPRRSQDDVNRPLPYLVYGMGNATNEGLTDSTAKHKGNGDRQFFQIWIHDQNTDYSVIDDLIAIVIKVLEGAQSVAHRILTVQYLETSQEFNNQTLNTNFRYIRFQAIRAKAG